MSSRAPIGVTTRFDDDLSKETATMMLYAAVTLLAVLTAMRESVDTGQVVVLQIVWGTTLGLALAHWFAFSVAARLIGGGEFGRNDVLLSLAQLGGAGVVAGLVTVPVLLLPTSSELDAARLLLAALIATAGFLVARSSGSGVARSLVGAAVTLAIALAVALVKNVVGAH